MANHTAWYQLWTKIPGFYTVNSSGSIVHPPGTTWTDVADLNVENRNMRDTTIASMKWWIKEYDIDGFRCDYADGLPSDFWRDAIRNTPPTADCTFTYLLERCFVECE